MLKTVILRTTLLFVLAALTGSVAHAQLWQAEDPKFPGTNRLLRRYKAIQTDLAGAASAATKDALLTQLADLKKDILAEEAKTAGSEELRSRLRFFREAVDKDVRRLQEVSLSPIIQPSSNIDPWDSVGYRTEVEAYRTAEEELRTHLCLEPTDGTLADRVAWNTQRDRLLLGMIIAEEKLAFAASGSFAREDTDSLAPIFRKQEEIRVIWNEAMRNDREAAELRKILAEYQAIVEGFSLDAASSKPGGIGLAVMMLGMRNAEYRLNQAETISVRTKTRIITPLREITDTVVSVYADMRTRGIGTINRQLGVGQRSFRVHRPVDRAQKAELERLLLAFVNSQMGVNLPIVRGIGSFPENSGITYVLFDQAEQRRFVNDQCIERSIASLRIESNNFASGGNVEISYTLPLQLRGKVWVGLMPSSRPHTSLKYINSEVDISQYQPKLLESRSTGVFQYSAPAAGGSYDVRAFEKETGREVAVATFLVSSVVRFEWHWGATHRLMNENDIFRCPPNPARNRAHADGTDRYSARWSLVCGAAVHAGIVTFERGGQFRLKFFAPDANFRLVGSTRNGITTGDYGSEGATFSFVKVD